MDNLIYLCEKLISLLTYNVSSIIIIKTIGDVWRCKFATRKQKQKQRDKFKQSGQTVHGMYSRDKIWYVEKNSSKS